MTTPFFDTLKFKKLSANAKTPTKAFESDAGTDLYASESVQFKPGQIRAVSTGISFVLPKHSYGKVSDRSSMSVKGWRVGAGVIDETYTGECLVVLQNMTNETMSVNAGDKIAQLVVMPVFETSLEEVVEVPVAGRGKNGFGSSGF